MKTWDAIIVGGGIIGMSLAYSLKKHGTQVLVVERGEPGREASHAAAGMLADLDPHTPEALRPMATASARMYPEFVHELQDESGSRADLRDDGTIYFPDPKATLGATAAEMTDGEKLKALEPWLRYTGVAVSLKERSVDPRALMAALLKVAKHREIQIASGSPATGLMLNHGAVVGVKTARTEFYAPVVVNCAGAWASAFGPGRTPTKPVKGQMLALIPSRRNLLRHVVRAPTVYLVPRSDGRIVVGSTLEDAGFDKQVNPNTIQHLHQKAAELLPELGQARILEAWAGLRPGTPDGLPILGRGDVEGYFLATGHYRDGILMAPITAVVVTQFIHGVQPEFDLKEFAPERFR
ncbi:MAG: glycine oxidase ThiO [Acidobacteriia bacterium]|nr:glycine oxidase ThiO [Terriglobia bacterium]